MIDLIYLEPLHSGFYFEKPRERPITSFAGGSTPMENFVETATSGPVLIFVFITICLVILCFLPRDFIRSTFQTIWSMLNSLSADITGFIIVVGATAWVFGGILGAIYWVIRNDALNVLLSMIIPAYGVLSVIYDLIFN